jgi:hypothetical protein
MEVTIIRVDLAKRAEKGADPTCVQGSVPIIGREVHELDRNKDAVACEN